MPRIWHRCSKDRQIRPGATNTGTDIYTFDTAIPVEIYDRKLEIRIADLV